MLVVFETKINPAAFKKQIHNFVSGSGILYVLAARLPRLLHKVLGNMLGKILLSRCLDALPHPCTLISF